MNKYKDLSKLLGNYSDEWVALSEDESRVVSNGKTVEEVLEKALVNGEKNPIITRVPKNYGNYVL